MSIDILFLIIAAICFGIAAFGYTYRKVNFIAAGLFFWVLTAII